MYQGIQNQLDTGDTFRTSYQNQYKYTPT